MVKKAILNETWKFRQSGRSNHQSGDISEKPNRQELEYDMHAVIHTSESRTELTPTALDRRIVETDI